MKKNTQHQGYELKMNDNILLKIVASELEKIKEKIDSNKKLSNTEVQTLLLMAINIKFDDRYLKLIDKIFP